MIVRIYIISKGLLQFFMYLFFIVVLSNSSDYSFSSVF